MNRKLTVSFNIVPIVTIVTCHVIIISIILEHKRGLKNKESNANFKEAMSVMDKLVSKGLIHKNKAARHKSRLNAHIKALA